ncbi:hypothetical protein FRB90_002036 [Tulasnella sp. 427]|nr:hypothetical protein FRB90_002036 [Tulasnella sp. 427]
MQSNVVQDDKQDDLPQDPQPFGSRYLLDEAMVFEQNAWDHVPPPDDQDERIQAALSRQRNAPVPEDKKEKYNSRPALFWDIFYKNNQNNFFKDRKWLHREFPQLETVTAADAGPKTIFEVGCGAGNVVWPLLAANQNPHLRIWACDFSKHAVRVVKSNPLYSNPPCGTVRSSVWDLSSQTLPEGLEPGSVDIAVMIFVLSALHPDEWAQAIANIFTLLKPGGMVVLRDYGRHDLTQLRFKEGRLLDENFYIRGDGTRVYFFEATELGRLFTGSTIEMKEDGKQLRMLKIIHEDEPSPIFGTPSVPTPSVSTPSVASAATEPPDLSNLSIDPSEQPEKPDLNAELEQAAEDEEESLDPVIPSGQDVVSPRRGPPPKRAWSPPPILKPSRHPNELPPHPLFAVKQMGIDRRLLVNRKKQLKMYRVWLQAEFTKVAADEGAKERSQPVKSEETPATTQSG